MQNLIKLSNLILFSETFWVRILSYKICEIVGTRENVLYCGHGVNNLTMGGWLQWNKIYLGWLVREKFVDSIMFNMVDVLLKFHILIFCFSVHVLWHYLCEIPILKFLSKSLKIIIESFINECILQTPLRPNFLYKIIKSITHNWAFNPYIEHLFVLEIQFAQLWIHLQTPNSPK